MVELVETITEVRDQVAQWRNEGLFGVGEDLESYPRDIAHDKTACDQAGASLIFHPAVDEMYYPDRSTTIHMADISEELCGKSRPIHFDGVCLVVNKLFNIVQRISDKKMLSNYWLFVAWFEI